MFVIFSIPGFPVRAELLPVKTYTVADGLLRDNIYKIRQDSRGFLWFCTAEGISRFDGYGFVNFTTDDGLPDRHVNDILETSKGNYLIATDRGLAELNPKGLRGSAENPLFKVYLPENSSAVKFTVLFEDKTGTLWAGAGGGLFRLVEKDGRFTFENVPLSKSLTETQSFQITCLLEDRRGALWVGTLFGGLIRRAPDEQTAHFTTADGLPSNNIASLVEDKNGRLWAGTRPDKNNAGGLVLLVPEPEANKMIAERVFTKKDGLPGNWISSLYQASDGNLWAGTTAGLCLLQENAGSVCKIYTAKNKLCDSETWSILEDKDGNLWTGTRCGAQKKARFGFTTFTESDGLAFSLVSSIFENRDGELFASVVFPKGMVSRFDGAGFKTVYPNFPADVDTFGWGWNQTVLEDSAGDWWFPTGRGLYFFPKPESFEDLAKMTPQKIESGAKGSEIFRVYEDSRRDVWIATTEPNELFRWERAANVWHDHTVEAGFSLRRIGTAFTDDRFGNLWIATGENDSALIRYRDGQFRTFTQAEGAPKGWTKDLFLDRTGRLWLATESDGLLRLDDTNDDKLRFAGYTTADGLSSNGSYCITEDEFGRIYVGSGRGLDRLNPDTGQIENFTTADGLPDSDVEVAYRDRHNTLWFGTVGGLARFVPEPEKPRTPPTVLITGLRVNGVAESISILGESEISNIKFTSDKRQVEVDFVGLGASLGEKMRYEYRLTGENWMPANERTLNFVNLASGDYLFEIRAVTADRIYSQKHASLSFYIAAPVWQRWWFILSAVALAALVIYGFYRYRVTKLLEIERTRTRIATDLHDDIGTNLSKISLLSEIVNLQLAKDNLAGNRLLDTIAEISRESVTSMSDIVWAINPQRDSMPELTRRMRSYAEGIFVEKDVRVIFNTPEDGGQLKLSMNVRREIYLIFKESVNNAAKHSECHRLEVDFRSKYGEIFLQISDNGRGFNVSQKTDGNGLANMQARAKSNGGKFEIESKPGSGTTIKLRFPQS